MTPADSHFTNKKGSIMDSTQPAAMSPAAVSHFLTAFATYSPMILAGLLWLVKNNHFVGPLKGLEQYRAELIHVLELLQMAPVGTPPIGTP